MQDIVLFVETDQTRKPPIILAIDASKLTSAEF